jgi:hypothetical protein
VKALPPHRDIITTTRARCLLNLLAFFALLLSLATLWLWRRSYGLYDGHQTVRQFMVGPEQHLPIRQFHSRRGVLVFLTFHSIIRDPKAFYPDDRNDSFRFVEDPVHHHPVHRFWNGAGFGVTSTREGTATSGLAVPHALPALLLAAFPAWRLARALRRRRAARAGLCPRCGYDLRATPDKCPECGHIPRGAA